MISYYKIIKKIFCNYILGIVTLSGFLYFWGWVFLITTSIVALLKKEVESNEKSHDLERDVKTAYTSLKRILELKSIQTLVVILLTCKVLIMLTAHFIVS